MLATALNLLLGLFPPKQVYSVHTTKNDSELFFNAITNTDNADLSSTLLKR